MDPAAEVGDRLLRRDEEALDRVAQVIVRARPAFVIVVCPAGLRPVALAYLRGKTAGGLPAPTVPRDADHLLELLTAQSGAKPGTLLSLDLGENLDSLLATLNLHREKLRSRGCTVLWLASVDELRAMHELAPDAYSFRDAVAIVQGAPVLSALVPNEEPEDVVEARKQLERARNAFERADAAERLSEELRKVSRLDEAESAVLRGWEELRGPEHDDEAGHERRASVCYSSAAVLNTRGASARAWRWALRGLAKAERVKISPQRLWLPAAIGGPYSSDRARLEAGLEEIRNGDPVDANAHHGLLRALAWNARSRGDLRGARASLEKARQLVVTEWNRAFCEEDAAQVEFSAGRLAEAERLALSARAAYANAHASAASIALLLAMCLSLRGEAEAAHDASDRALAERPTIASGYRLNLQQLLAELSLSTGDPACLTDLHRVIQSAAEQGVDRVHYDACESLSTAAIQLHEAGLITDDDLRTVESDLAVAQDASFSMVGDDPPWYVIRFPGLRSEVLSHHPTLRSNAISLAEQALARARADWPELAPEQGRRFLSALLASGRTTDALHHLPTIEAEARREEIYVELVKILRLAVAAAASENRLSEMERAMAALRETFSVTDSPRLQADTLLDLALSLPPTLTAPDPLALAEEAHALFLDMPMPAPEARCLEVIGDVLLARGQPEEARRRYQAAHHKLTRYGLTLRVPCLTRKLAAVPP